MSNYHQSQPPLPPRYSDGSVRNTALAPSGSPQRSAPGPSFDNNTQYPSGYMSPQPLVPYPASHAPPATSVPTNYSPNAAQPSYSYNSYPPPPAAASSTPVSSPSSAAYQSYPPPPPPRPQQQEHSYHAAPASPYNPAQSPPNQALQPHPAQPAAYYSTPPPHTYPQAPYATTPATTASSAPLYQYASPPPQGSGAYPPSQTPTAGSHGPPYSSSNPPPQQAGYVSSPPAPPPSTRPPLVEQAVIPTQNIATSPLTQVGQQPQISTTGWQSGTYHPAQYPPAQSTGYQHQYPASPAAAPPPPQQSAPPINISQNPNQAPIQASPAAYRPHNSSTAAPPALPPRTGGQLSNPPTPAYQNHLDGLSAQMNSLSVEPSAQVPTAQPYPRVLDDNAPRPPPNIRATGQPLDVIPYCTETRLVDYSLYWYRLPSIPKFMICTRCHADYIQGTQLAGQFERFKGESGIIALCCFWFPRVKEVLWPQAVRSGNMDALCAFMKKRVDMNLCKGQSPVPASEGIKWFGLVNREINGFISCEACYEDRIMGTPFEGKFIPHAPQKTDEKWSCDLAVPYMAQAVVKMAKRNDWAGFVAGASRRMTLPKCEGKDVQSNSCTWYVPRRNMENMVACEACYMDKLAVTRFAHEFGPYNQPNGLDSFIHHFTQLWSCKLADTNLPMAFALGNAIEQRDLSVFMKSAEQICRLVPCTANGIVRGNWWTITGGCENFDICEACHVGILRTGGVAQFFQPARRPPEQTLVCDFCIASPRFRYYLNKYAESIDKGVFSYYTDYVRKYSTIAVCPGVKTAEKVKWWGYPEALFCQDCYLSFVEGYALGKTVPMKGVYDERKQICQIWSSRMRKMWMDVCAAGPPGSPESNAKLAEFRAFTTKRLQIYVQTVPQMDQILALKKMKMQNAMHQGMRGVMYNGMDGLLSVSGATDGNLHGNSQLGWYDTTQGAQGAQMFNNMQSGFASANRVDEWMQMHQLETIWKQVE